MRRRDFIKGIFGSAGAWPLAARAQQAAMPIIGFLHSGSPEQNGQRLAAYLKGLSDAGFVEAKNAAIEFRWAEGHEDRLPAFAADLVRRQVAVIIALFSTPAALAAKAATTTIPIVLTTPADPVALGLIASFNRPGGNVTGFTAMNSELAAKQLGQMRSFLPKAARCYGLVNPTSTLAEPFIGDLQAGAARLGVEVEILRASTGDEIDAAFANLPRQAGSNVLVVSADPFFYFRHAQIIALAAHLAMPAIYDSAAYVEAGGLMSYGADLLDVAERAGTYTGRILKGDKPTDLPFVQSTKYELVINLQTAKTLGLDVPPNLLAIADKVIE
jgi:putative tryptophan/tyrosine transport system substrate-binding protein